MRREARSSPQTSLCCLVEIGLNFSGLEYNRAAEGYSKMIKGMKLLLYKEQTKSLHWGKKMVGGECDMGL